MKTKKSISQFFIDSKGSFVDNYKSLTPSQVKGLNKDTQSLIKTQKQLIETLRNTGPALKDGKEIFKIHSKIILVKMMICQKCYLILKHKLYNKNLLQNL